MISDETPRTAASALLAELEREDAALEAAMRPTVEEERAVMAATQQQAAEHGDSAKAGGEHGWVGSMMRKFERFLEKHGDTYGYDAKEGLDGGSQSLVLVRAFMDYCFSGLGREQTFSGVGRKGFADEYFSLHLPYALAQKVFPMMKMVGWVGLEKHELQAKAVPFKCAILEYWQRLRNSRSEMEELGRSLRKEKWDDLSYFRVQDACVDRLETRTALALTQLVLMGFVRATCSRSGSMGISHYLSARARCELRCASRV